MVVSNAVYIILELIILLLSITYILFMFIKRKNISSIIIRLICIFIVTVIEVFKMPTDIVMGQSCIKIFFAIIVCIILFLVPLIEIQEKYNK